MAQQHLKFAIFGNEYQAKKSASIEKILLYLEKKEAEVYVENAYYEFLIRDQHLDVKAAGVFEDYNFDVDYVISMGGDGTFLKAASRVGAKGTNWVSITQACVEYVVSQKPFVLKRFNYTFCPDEFFLQTLVWNHPDFRAALYSEKDEYEGCMRLIDWKRGNPYVWTLADKEELEQSNRLFARKFDMKHEDIIRWIKASC